MTKIKLVKPWGRLKAGQSVEFFGGVADILIRRGFAELDAPKRPAAKKRTGRKPKVV